MEASPEVVVMRALCLAISLGVLFRHIADGPSIRIQGDRAIALALLRCRRGV